MTQTTKFYIKWELNALETPKNPEDRIKLWMSMVEMIKAEIKAGLVKDWGMSAGGTGGYGIREEQGETELLAHLMKYMPYVNFEAVPVVNIDQVQQAIKMAIHEARK